MNIQRIISPILGLAVFLTGCDDTILPNRLNNPDETGELHATEVQPEKPLPFVTGSGGNKPPDFFYMISIKMSQVEVPPGVASGSEDLWSYLDEEPLAEKIPVLGLNGFRVGLAKGQAVNDVKRVLKQMTGREEKTLTLQAASAKPAAIPLKYNAPIQTIFTYRPDQTLSGQDYPPGDNRLMVAAGLNQDRPDGVLLSLFPQIQTLKKIPRMISEHGKTRFVSEPVIYNFPELSFKIRIPAGNLLIIGPGSQSRRPTSLAGHFLRKTRGGIEYETLILLQPVISKVRIKK